MIGAAGFMAAPKSHGEINDIMAGMDRAMHEWVRSVERKAPRCHFRPMMLEGWSDEQWWECSHCGHTKDIGAPAQEPGEQKGGAAPHTRCAAGRDGECGHAQCPQLRDGEPRASGRHCPLDSEGGHHD